MKTTINVECIDQELIITNSPLIASGGVHENFIAFNFCEKWDGFGKTAVFYRNEKERYYSVLDLDDVCEVPHEVTDYEGTMYFGVYGELGEVTRTSKVLKYKINQGAMTTLLKPSEEPTPDIYQQLLSAYGQTNKALAREKEERQAENDQLSSEIEKNAEDILTKTSVSTFGHTLEVFVSAQNGSDDIGDGSQKNPYASLDKAISLYNNKPIGYGVIIINILDDSVYDVSAKSIWEGSPHIIGLADKMPTLNFINTAGTGARMYSCHPNLQNLKINAEYGSYYFEGCAVSMQNVEFLCGIGFIGCTINIQDPIINTSTPHEKTGLVRCRATVGRISNPKCTTNCDYPTFYIDFGSNISITGNSWSANNSTTTTKAVIYLNYADLKITACPTFTGYTNVIESNNGNLFTSASGYDLLKNFIKQTNTLIKYGNHDLSKLIGLVRIRKINVGNLVIDGDSIGNLKTESIAIDGFRPVCVVNTLMKNAETEDIGVNSSYCNAFYSDIDGDRITLAIRNFNTEQANIEIHVEVLYICEEYYKA